jgi:hypothetical protein
LVATLTSDASGHVSDTTRSCRDPVPATRVLPLLI